MENQTNTVAMVAAVSYVLASMLECQPRKRKVAQVARYGLVNGRTGETSPTTFERVSDAYNALMRVDMRQRHNDWRVERVA